MQQPPSSEHPTPESHRQHRSSSSSDAAARTLFVPVYRGTSATLLSARPQRDVLHRGVKVATPTDASSHRLRSDGQAASETPTLSPRCAPRTSTTRGGAHGVTNIPGVCVATPIDGRSVLPSHHTHPHPRATNTSRATRHPRLPSTHVARTPTRSRFLRLVEQGKGAMQDAQNTRNLHRVAMVKLMQRAKSSLTPELQERLAMSQQVAVRPLRRARSTWLRCGCCLGDMSILVHGWRSISAGPVPQVFCEHSCTRSVKFSNDLRGERGWFVCMARRSCLRMACCSQPSGPLSHTMNDTVARLSFSLRRTAGCSLHHPTGRTAMDCGAACQTRSTAPAPCHVAPAMEACRAHRQSSCQPASQNGALTG